MRSLVQSFRSLWYAGASLLQPRILQFILDNLLKNDRQAMFKDGMLLIALAVIGVIAGILNVYFAYSGRSRRY